MGRSLSAILLVATALAGCVVDVVLDLGRCVDGEGAERASGEVYDTYASGLCETCTCDGGKQTCTPCGCTFDDGRTGPPGSVMVATDGCSSCTCQADGTVVCTPGNCLACSGEPITCPQPPAGCTNQAVCTDVGWACQRTCEGCDLVAADAFMGCAAPPPGCWYIGPICEDGVWACGDLVCQGCQGEPIDCSDASMMGCVGYAVCDGLEWVCEMSCGEPNCPEPAIDCSDPNLPPECYTYAICDPMIGWLCQSECYGGGCMEPPPMCESMMPNCAGAPYCDGMSWQCEFVCQ